MQLPSQCGSTSARYRDVRQPSDINAVIQDVFTVTCLLNTVTG